jgi:hypothetical protein
MRDHILESTEGKRPTVINGDLLLEYEDPRFEWNGIDSVFDGGLVVHGNLFAPDGGVARLYVKGELTVDGVAIVHFLTADKVDVKGALYASGVTANSIESPFVNCYEDWIRANNRLIASKVILDTSGGAHADLNAEEIGKLKAIQRKMSSAIRKPKREDSPIVYDVRTVIEGDLILTKDTVYEGDLTVNGHLLGENGKRYSLEVKGNLKVNGMTVVNDLTAYNIKGNGLNIDAMRIRTVNIKDIALIICETLEQPKGSGLFAKAVMTGRTELSKNMENLTGVDSREFRLSCQRQSPGKEKLRS